MKEFPLEYPECQYCGSTELVGKMATTDGQPLHQDLLMLENPLGLTVPALVIHRDYCAECGRQRIVKIEKKHLPVTAQPPQMPKMQIPPGFSGRG